MKPPRSTAEHIAASATLATLRRQAARLEAATRALDLHLGPPLAGHASVARLEATEVTLIADTATWATRLRFVAPDLGHLFAAHLAIIEPPRIRVHVGRPRAVVAEVRRAPLSKYSARVLAESGAHMPDPRLGAVLARLARRAAVAPDESGGGEG